MLQFRRSLQSKPSILTAGLLPKLGRMQLLLPPPPTPPFLEEEDGDGGSRTGDNGVISSSPKRKSCINGLATLLGGDPQKNGGDEANTCVQDCSKNSISMPPQPPCSNQIIKLFTKKHLTNHAMRKKVKYFHVSENYKPSAV